MRSLILLSCLLTAALVHAQEAPGAPGQDPPAAAPPSAAPPSAAPPSAAPPSAAPPSAAPPSAAPPSAAPPAAPPSAAPASATKAPSAEPAPVAGAAQLHLELSVIARRTPTLDLAAIAGRTGFGADSDAATGNLGLQLSVGIEIAPLEFGVDLSQSVGGLDGAKVDGRYFDGSDPAARAVTKDAGLRLWWVFQPSADLKVMIGPHARWITHASASGVSEALLNAFGVGGQLGLRWRVSRIAALMDGSLRLLASVHGSVATSVDVRRANGEVLFATSEPEGSFVDISLTLGYALTFR